MRKLLTMLGIVSLLALAVPTAVFANTATCGTPPGNWYFAGMGMTNTTKYFDLVSATIDPSITSTDFAICSTTPLDFEENGPLAWVAITGSTAESILQIGVTVCSEVGNGTCDGNTHPSFFWAYGGCNGASPFLRDLGPADSTIHKYKIEKSASSWVLYIDDVPKAAISFSHSAISCWNYGHIELQIMAEKWDRGDSFGDPSTSGRKLQFRSVRYSYTTSSTVYAKSWGPIDGPCTAEDRPEDRCRIAVSDGFNVWTDR